MKKATQDMKQNSKGDVREMKRRCLGDGSEMVRRSTLGGARSRFRLAVVLAALLLPLTARAQTPITDASGLNAMAANGNYIITQDITISGNYTTKASFTGTLTAQAKADGTFPVITGLNVPLFTTATDATISNIMLKSVSISQTGYVGAIACTANGTTRIYNCGILPTTAAHEASGRSTVASTDNHCGSLVGYLDGYARVINCFSYANVSAPAGNSKVAGGLVGYNTTATMQGNTQANFDKNVKTMVMNCIFYGDITQGNIKRPVYGGTTIANNASDRTNNYNYFCQEEASYEGGLDAIAKYNNSWPVAKKYLVRFEVYRNILNSNRRLCAWWITGTYLQNSPAQSDADVAAVGIAKWVLDPTIAPYPILKQWKKYYSSFDMDPDNVYHAQTGVTESRGSAKEWEGKSYPSITVTIKGGENNSSASTSRSIVVTDMDTLGYDYCAKKIQLPYYNEVFGNPNGADWAAKYANNYTNKVVTGWKITKVNGSSTGTGPDFVKNWETGYNFADRTSTKKDLYSVSGRVFAQGGYYYVPDGVESIEIEAYWGTAVYLHNPNHCLDRVYNGTQDFYVSGKLPDKINNTYAIKTSLSDAISALSVMSSGSVYDQAIVLVGNYQNNAFHSNITLKGSDYNTKAKPFTIMSADFDFDNEPDFCFQAGMSNGGRINCHPIRFDFLMVPDITMAIRTDGNYYGMRIFCPQGHFEITETSFLYTTQFEYDKRNSADYAKHEAPMILNGGEHMQIVSTESFAEAETNATATSPVNGTSYFLMGGKVYMKAFTPGTHGNRKAGTRHCAVNAIGGEFPELYLSGMFRSDFYNMTDNPHCYIDGGKFGLIAGAGMESVGAAGETDGGNVTFVINNAWIDEFYGGGINALRPVTGNIDVTCDNSIVHKYCGGPKLGDMSSTKTITNRATNTVFTQYYGGGNGGTNMLRDRRYDSGGGTSNPTTAKWNGDGQFTAFTPFKYEEGKGYQAEYEFELLPMPKGGDKSFVVRSYFHWASFAKTTVAPVTNTITDCTFKGNFYGGGNLGAVGGNVTSTLKGHTVVNGSAFAAGYSASIPSFKVHDKSTVSYAYADKAGYIHDGSLSYGAAEYNWIHDVPSEWNISPAPSTDNPTFEHGGVYYAYTPVELTGLGAVNGIASISVEGTSDIKGDVYGGGDESAVNGSATVSVQGTAHVRGNVFGGGNKGLVTENSTVTCGNATTEQLITVDGSVYGGGNLADVGTTTSDATTLNILSGTIEQNVFGGGKGNSTKAPEVKGTVNVNIGATDGQEPATYTGKATINGSVYGCNDAAGTPKGDVFVNIYKTKLSGNNVATYTGNDATYAIAQVFGGGKRADYVPALATTPHKTTVTIFGCHNTVEDIYGGGDAAAVEKCAVVVWGGRHGRIFAGGNGHSETGNHTDPYYDEVNSVCTTTNTGVACADYNPGAKIGEGGTSLTVNAGLIKQVFGGSNEYGDLLGPVSVTIAHPDNQCAADPNDAERIGEFFGGSNMVTMGSDAHPVTITTTIECGTGTFSTVYGGSNQADIIGNVTLNIKGGTIDTVFGGSKGVRGASPVEANILDARNDDTEHTPKNTHGNVTLNLFGGTIGTAFGGSNQKGNIEGAITVNVFDYEGTCALNITGNIYGAGNVTPYTPLAFATTGTKNTPKVNLLHIQRETGIGGSVYGGGYGSTAEVTAKPLVNIGYDAANMSTLLTSLRDASHQSSPATSSLKMRVAGSVYGGGKEAPVIGDIGQTYVRVNAGSAVDHSVFGGGDEATVSGRSSIDMVGGTVTEDIFGGGNKAKVGSTLVSMTGGSVRKAFGGGNNVTDGGVDGAVAVNISGSAAISGGLYGGCNTNGTVTGNITVAVNGGNIGAAQVGEVGDANYVAEKRADIHGGGYGADTKTGANVEVTIGSAGDGTGPIVYGDVYGGSALGSVGNTSEAVNDEKHTYVTMNKGTVNGDIFGGGLGESGDANVAKGRVWTPVVVTVNEGTVTGSVYGCNNTNGAPRSTVAVVVAGGTVANVYGGGNNAAYTSPDATKASPLVTIKGSGEVTGNVFGGGNNAAVTGSSAVRLQEGATVRGSAFGGGNKGAVNGSSSVTIQDE